MSWTPVTPSLFRCSWASLNDLSLSSLLGSGMRTLTIPAAFSLKTPVGAPLGSRSISPPAGSGVASVTPAIRIAIEFTQTLCPSNDLQKTGLPGTALSSIAAVGKSSEGQVLFRQPLATIHSPSPVPAARSATRAAHSSGLPASKRLTFRRDSPRETV